MTDNPLIKALAKQLDAAVALFGWDYEVIQKDNPTQAGVNTDPGVYLEKLFDHRYGWPMVKKVVNPETGLFETTESQLMETTFQISAQVIQNPEDLTMPTASDVANAMAQYVASVTVVPKFKASGIGILRVTQVRNPYFVDDMNRFEANPNFDLVVTHRRKTIFSADKITRIEEEIYSV